MFYNENAFEKAIRSIKGPASICQTPKGTTIRIVVIFQSKRFNWLKNGSNIALMIGNEGITLMVSLKIPF